MNIITAILYGILQGFTEFLPVSSSGHLSLLQNFFGMENFESSQLTFTVLLHLGTLLAVCIVYYRDIWELIKGFFSLVRKLFTGRIKEKLTYGERLFLMLCVATVPLIPAALFSGYVEFISSVSWAIGTLLILNGIMLFVSDRLSNSRYTLANAPILRAFIVGLVQLFGVLPGISRSGSTITGGLFMGFKKQDAVKFSFLMSIPAIAGANILELKDVMANPLPEGSLLPFICGIVAAALSGLAAIRLLQYITKSKRLSVFSLYCIIIGAIAIVADIII